MVTFLDTGLLGVFSLVFIFLLVYAVVWGILVSRKPFGDNNGLYAIIAVGVAFLMIISRPAIALLETIIPWYTVLAIAFMMVLITVSVFTDVRWSAVLENDTARTWLIILIAGVFAAGVAFTFGQATLEAGTGQAPQPVPALNPETGNVSDITHNQRPSQQGQASAGQDFETNLISTLVHPKVLGVLLIFLLGLMIVFFLSRPAGGL